MEINTTYLLFGLVIFLAILSNFIKPKKQSKSSSNQSDYVLYDSLLTNAEIEFYAVLSKTIPSDLNINIKPRIADFVNVEPFDQARFNKIKAKHVDFLLCNRSDMKPRLAIELDDSTHSRKKVAERDRFVTSLYNSIGLPICRFKVKSSYDLEKISLQIASALGRSILETSN